MYTLINKVSISTEISFRTIEFQAYFLIFTDNLSHQTIDFTYSTPKNHQKVKLTILINTIRATRALLNDVFTTILKQNYDCNCTFQRNIGL